MLLIAIAIVIIILIIYFINYCNTPYVVTIDSGVPGKTIGIVGSIHGNEPAGAATLDELIKDGFKPRTGKLVLIYANRGGRLLNTRRNPATLHDTNRQFDTNNDIDNITDPLAKNIINVLTNNGCDLIIDLHEGWGYYNGPLRNGTRSVGSTIAPSDDRIWVFLAPMIIAELNKSLPNGSLNSHQPFTIRWNDYCNIPLSLNCYAHKKHIPYILVETSGQGDIQPLSIRVNQMKTIINVISNHM